MSSHESKGRIMSVQLSTVAHATEDAGKVEMAMLNTLPVDLRDSTSISRQNLKGHHGNPMVMLTIRMSRGKAVKSVIQNLFTMMIMNEKHEVNLDFENLLDENGNFYVRLDKQEALKGKIKLATRDPIRIKMKARMFRPTPNGVREIFKDLGM